MRFAGKVALVTGGSSGIGAATAIAFAKEGARVAIIGRNEDKLAKVAADCGNALILKIDITNDKEVATAIQQTIEKFDRLDILVNNAGINLFASILQGNLLQVYDECMAVNLRAVVHLTILAAPHLIKTKGNIINISGVWGAGTPKIPAAISSAITKAGLNHFTKGAAVELAPHGVRVNAISPGPVKTDIIANTGYSWDQFECMTAMNRVSDAEEIANVVLFLAGDKAKSVTGSNYVIDNGMLLL